MHIHKQLNKGEHLHSLLSVIIGTCCILPLYTHDHQLVAQYKYGMLIMYVCLDSPLLNKTVCRKGWRSYGPSKMGKTMPKTPVCKRETHVVMTTESLTGWGSLIGNINNQGAKVPISCLSRVIPLPILSIQRNRSINGLPASSPSRPEAAGLRDVGAG